MPTTVRKRGCSLTVSEAEGEAVKESVVVAQCLEWLAKHRIFCWRNNTGSYRTPEGRFIRYGHVGSGDIIGITPVVITSEMVGRTVGLFTAIECKTATGKQSKPQQVFQTMIERNGGVYIVARSTSDLERAIVQLEHLTP